MHIILSLVLAAFIVGCLSLASNEERANQNMLGHRAGKVLQMLPEILLAIAVDIGFTAGAML